MILAEELDADLAQVALEHAPPSDKLYGNPAFGIQATGNSNSIRAWWQGLREAGAAARAMLVQAAAKQWKVDPASCTASSEVTHKDSGRKLSYGELASAASSETPKDVPLKDDAPILPHCANPAGWNFWEPHVSKPGRIKPRHARLSRARTEISATCFIRGI